MSEQHAEIIRRQVEAVNRGDVETVLSDMDAEIEFIPQRAAVQGVYHGHDGVRDFFADTFENFDSLKRAPTRFASSATASFRLGRCASAEREAASR